MPAHTLLVVLLIVLVILMLGAAPRFGYAPAAWGWYPSSALLALVVILILLRVLGVL
jgi:hypothetical protein